MILQLKIHRIDDKQRVLRPPRGGLRLQQRVFERLPRKRQEAGIHACRVGFDRHPVVGRHLGPDGLGPDAEPVKAMR